MKIIGTVHDGYPKEGTPESRAHGDKVRAALPRFSYEAPKVTFIAVPLEDADAVRRLLDKRRADRCLTASAA